MKKRFILINTVVACTLMLGGCVHNGQMVEAVPTTKQHYQPTYPDQVMVYNKADMPRHSTVIGKVTAMNHNFMGMTLTQEKIMRELKRGAASLGANGIKHVRTGQMETTAEAIIVK